MAIFLIVIYLFPDCKTGSTGSNADLDLACEPFWYNKKGDTAEHGEKIAHGSVCSTCCTKDASRDDIQRCKYGRKTVKKSMGSKLSTFLFGSSARGTAKAEANDDLKQADFMLQCSPKSQGKGLPHRSPPDSFDKNGRAASADCKKCLPTDQFWLGHTGSG